MSDEFEPRAREMGWVPKEEYREAPEKWVDAKAFVEHNDTVLPILRANNRKLHEGMTVLQNELAAEKAARAETTATIEELKKFHTEQVAERVKQTRESLVRELAAARKEDNVEAEIKITEDLENLRTAEVAAKKEEVAEKIVTQPAKELDPIVSAWVKENDSWFGKDEEKTALAIAAADKARRAGKTGQDVMDAAKARVDEVFGNVRREHIDRTESTRHSDSRMSGGNGSDYNSLPSDAKQQCDKDGARFIGKPGFPDEKAWRKHFVEQYNAGA